MDLAPGCAPGFLETAREWDETRRELPVYRTPRGKFKPITGRAAETWPFPRECSDVGAVFIERPRFLDTKWAVTYHTTQNWRHRTWVGTAIGQYVEGRMSGFPFWSSLYFSLRSTLLYNVLKRKPPTP